MIPRLELLARQVGVMAALLIVGAVSEAVAAGDSKMDSITNAAFGTAPDGTAVSLYTLGNRHGMQARIATYGGIVVSLTAADRSGRYGDVVLGFDSLADYVAHSPYFGALIGRYGNRIARGKFTLDGTTYSLPINDPPNSLHGGKVGFDKVVWSVVKAQVTPRGPQLTLTYLSRDADQGYPGNLSVTAVYTLTEDNALQLDYKATTDKATVINLTQHSYFNLRGHGDVLGHIVQINASRFTPVDKTLIPTGELRPVDGTPFDFRTPTPIGARIAAHDEQLEFGHGGYDLNWVVDPPKSSSPASAAQLPVQAVVYEPESGRVLEVLSAQPGVQFYTGNFLDGTLTGKGGQRYEVHDAFCFEPQHFPDSPNHPSFPSVVLKPGKTYHNTIIYKFSAR